MGEGNAWISKSIDNREPFRDSRFTTVSARTWASQVLVSATGLDLNMEKSVVVGCGCAEGGPGFVLGSMMY